MALADQALEERTTTAAELTGIIEGVASFVSSFEAGRYSSGDAALLVKVFARGERLCAAGKTVAAARAAEANAHQLAGHRSPAHWLAEVTGESVGDAMGVLAIGDALASQPGVDDAFRSGKLSRSRARAVTDAVKVNPRCEDQLVEAAQSDTMGQLRDRCLRAKAQGRSKEDEAAHYQALRRNRSCRTWTDQADGAFRLEARLAPDDGAALLAALRAESDRVFHRARKAGMIESPDAYAADALVALITGQATRGTSSSDDSDSQSPSRQSRSSSNVHVRVDLDALRQGAVSHGQICEIPGVGPIPIERARQIMGDALVKLVITNGVDVSTVCNLGRAIPAAVIDALIERDPTCVVPGCDVAVRLETDHWQVDYGKGGPTRWSNLARLCKFHHNLKTHKGFRLQGGPGNWRWVPPKRTRSLDPPATTNDDPDPPLFTSTE